MQDFLFANNNRTILKQMAKADLKGHKLKTTLTAIIIVLATCLIAVICTVLVNDALSRMQIASYHVMYRAVEEETKNKLQTDADFAVMGVYKEFGNIVDDSGHTNLAYMDENAMSLLGFELLEGTLPTGVQEAAVSKTYLELHQLSIGDYFDYSYTDILTNQQRKQQFMVCGIIENQTQEAGKQFYIVASDDYRTLVAQQADSWHTSAFSTQTPANMDLLLRLNAEKAQMPPEEQIAYLKAKGESLGVQSYDVVLNLGYIEGFLMDESVLIAIVCFVIFLMFASGFVIYSIFYISVSTTMPMYAQLMSLGTTQKQLRCFLHMQGNILSMRFIPLGMLLSLLLSMFISRAVLSSATEWMAYDLAIILLSGLLVFVTIKIALRKPAKFLSTVSPIEAMQYIGDLVPKKHRELKRITPGSLAKNNLTVNRKKNYMSILSLSISGMFIIAFTTLLASINLPAMMLESYPLQEDFQIGIQMDNFYERFPQVVHNNPLSTELENELSTIPGVEKIIRDECVIGNLLAPQIAYETPEDNTEVLDSLSPELLNNVSEVVSGSIAYADLGTDGILINKYRTDHSELNYDDIQVGDQLLFQFSIDNVIYEKSFRVVGIAYFPSTGLFYTTPEIIKSISPYRNVSHLSIFCDAENRELVKSTLQKIVSRNPNLRLQVYAEDYIAVAGYIHVMMNALYGISIFVLLFGILHMVNMLISSAIIRKKEFALLQAVGMTSQQLGRMLNWEGLYISVSAVAIAAICGILLGKWFCYLAYEVMALKFILFSVPVWSILLYAIVLIGLQLLVSYCICKSIEKDTLTERLRAE